MSNEKVPQLRLSEDDEATFLADLRLLRDQAAIDYEELAGRAHYPVDVLTEAESGPGLPTWPVTAAYVTACGGDPIAWEERWRRLTSMSPGADDDLPSRPRGASAAAAAGAKAGVSAAPAEAYDADRIRAALRAAPDGNESSTSINGSALNDPSPNGSADSVRYAPGSKHAPTASHAPADGYAPAGNDGPADSYAPVGSDGQPGSHPPAGSGPPGSWSDAVGTGNQDTGWSGAAGLPAPPHTASDAAAAPSDGTARAAAPRALNGTGRVVSRSPALGVVAAPSKTMIAGIAALLALIAILIALA